MSVFRFGRWIVASWLVLAGVAQANDSGPGPGSGATSRAYNVLVLRAGSVDQGTMTFSAAMSSSPDGSTTEDSTTTGGTSTGGTTNTGTAANPTATGNFSPILPGSFGAGNTAGNTSGSSGVSNTSGMNGTTTTTSAEASLPASYWTTARANGRDTTNTTDSSSLAYWTRARANGQVQPGDSTSNGGNGGIGSNVATGSFTASFTSEQTSGTWYAIDLGNFSLWFATGDSADGMVTFAGYATPEMIAGRTSVGTGGFMEALFTGSFFVGQASADSNGDETTDESDDMP